MSFAGIVVWNAKYGVPHSHDEAQDMQEQVEQVKSNEIDPAFVKLAEAVQSFTRQALPFYGHEVLGMYENCADNFEEEQGTNPIMDFEYVPRDLKTIFVAVIVQVAQEHNLVVRYDSAETLFLPNGQVYLDDALYSWHADDFVAENMALWQKKIKSFANVEDKDEQELFSNESLFEKYTNALFKQQIKKRKLKAKKLSNTAYLFDTERMQVVLSIYPWSMGYNKIEQKYIPQVASYIEIYINDIPKRNIAKRIDNTSFSLPSARQLQISYAEFFKTPKKPNGRRVYAKAMGSKAECEAYVEQNFDMLVYMLEHCQSLKDFYTLYDNCEHNEHLRPDEPSTPVWKGGIGYQTLTMLYLAYLTKQADYPQRVEQYRQEYLQYVKERIEADQQLNEKWKANGQSYTELPPFEQMFTIYVELFDRLVAFIESLDVEAILSAPPVRRDEELKNEWSS